ncbi:hypothetical protein CPB83DRAFT_908207 [Crepidotus variabilis]|uniref:Uncharacterized protein n=1 Tax=Crepidotus variabilis TaxID=179855 RepID=A0A9P6ED11_9AGAR|nr:hypothetical protein CPB83DRAFT_908207 [Crepidotus variabilis]
MLPVLPQEILEYIIDTSVASNPHRKHHLPTLLSCALACSQTRIRAQYHIFSSVDLLINSDIQAITRRLLNIFKTNTLLTRFVRDLKLTFCTLNWLYVSNRQTGSVLSRHPFTRLKQEWRRYIRDFSSDVYSPWFGDSLVELLRLLAESSSLQMLTIRGKPITLTWDEVITTNVSLSKAIESLVSKPTMKTLNFMSISSLPPRFFLRSSMSGSKCAPRRLAQLVLKDVGICRSTDGLYDPSTALITLQTLEKLTVSIDFPLDFFRAGSPVNTEPDANGLGSSTSSLIFSTFTHLRHLGLRILSDPRVIQQCRTVLDQLSSKLETLIIYPSDEHAVLEFTIRIIPEVSFPVLHTFKLDVFCSPSVYYASAISQFFTLNLLLPILGESLERSTGGKFGGLKILQLDLRTTLVHEEQARARDNQGPTEGPNQLDYMVNGWRAVEDRLIGRDLESSENRRCVHSRLEEMKTRPMSLMSTALGYSSETPSPPGCERCDLSRRPAFPFLETFRVRILFWSTSLALGREEEVRECGWERVSRIKELMPRLCGNSENARGVGGINVEFDVEV